MRYAVFLRAVNVGGHNKVPMPKLRDIATDLGYADVATYVQSGNLAIGATNAKAALLKIEAVLPPELRANVDRSHIFAPSSTQRIEATGIIDRLHSAVIDHHVLRMTYRDEAGSGTEREIEPLCLAFWGGVWTLGAWCRLRVGFRNFRPDRIAAFDTTGEIFVETPQQAGEWLRRNLREGDAVLLKASRGVRLEQALTALDGLSAPG